MDTFREVGPEAAPERGATRHVIVPIHGERPKSLHLRLALLVAGTVLPVLVLAGFIIVSGYARTRNSSADRVVQTAKSAMAAVERELQNQISALQVLALEPEIVQGDFEEFRDDAELFIQVRGGYVIAVSDAAGNQVFNSQLHGELSPWVNRDALRQVVATKRPAISELYVGAVTSAPTFTVNVPVLRDGEVAYVIGYSPGRAVYQEILRRLSLPDKWIVSLYESGFHLVARQPPLQREGIISASDRLRSEFQVGNNRIVRANSLADGTPILAAFTHSDEIGWVMAIGMPQESLDGPARNTLLLAAAVGGSLLLVGLFFASNLATRLVRAEAQRSLLMNELNHRVKNTLSAVQGIVARGLPDLPQNDAYRNAAESRLLALSSAHNILSGRSWESASLSDLAKAVIEPYGSRDRMRVDGPEVILAPRTAIPLAMILNELATNAVKYGALSAGAGSLTLSWDLVSPDRLRVVWRESGGPVTQPPVNVGYGTKFIERAVVSELRGKYESAYLAEGFTCTIEIPL